MIGHKFGNTWDTTYKNCAMTASGDEYIYRADFTDYNGDNYFRLHDGAFEYGASDTDKVVVLGEEYTLTKNSKNSFKGNDNLNGKKVIFHFSPSANRFWVTEDQKSVATSVSLSISPIETKLGKQNCILIPRTKRFTRRRVLIRRMAQRRRASTMQRQ